MANYHVVPSGLHIPGIIKEDDDVRALVSIAVCKMKRVTTSQHRNDLTDQEVANSEGIPMTPAQSAILFLVVDANEQCLLCPLALLRVRRPPVQFADLHGSRNCVAAV